MKLRGYIALVLAGCMLLFGGCQQEQTLPLEQPVELIFSSGAGAWASVITLNSDGAFEGVYRDTDMGACGEDHPNGTVYTAVFSGRFTDIQPLDAYSYSLRLTELTTEKEVGAEWIEDGVLYKASAPAGLVDGEVFIFYLPGAPVDTLPADLLDWYPVDRPENILPLFALYNQAAEQGFFSLA